MKSEGGTKYTLNQTVSENEKHIRTINTENEEEVVMSLTRSKIAGYELENICEICTIMIT